MPIDIKRQPKYEVLARTLEEHIDTGKLPAGQPVPSIRTLMASTRFSQATILQGLGLLEKRGLVHRMPDRGYFVRDRHRPDPGVAQIAFITPSLAGDTHAFSKGISEALGSQEKYTLATYSSNADLHKYQEMINRVARLRPAGVILSYIPKELLTLQIDCLTRAGIPTVIIGGETPGLDCDRVNYNGRDTGRKLMPYLLQKGYRDFSLLTTDPKFEPARLDLISIIRHALQTAGLDLPDNRIFTFRGTHGYTNHPDPYIDAQERIESALAQGVQFKTLLCCHDYPAVGALRAFLAAGLRIPQDVQVASLASCAVEGITPMKLTTMEVSGQVRGMMAGELLLKRIEGFKGHPEIHYISADLIVGETA